MTEQPPAPRRGRGRPAPAPARDTFGYRLRAARMRMCVVLGRTVSQQMFARYVSERLGEPWHQTRLSRLEQNESEPSFAELMALADVTGCAIPWLAFGIEAVDGVDPETRAAWLARYRAREP